MLKVQLAHPWLRLEYIALHQKPELEFKPSKIIGKTEEKYDYLSKTVEQTKTFQMEAEDNPTKSPDELTVSKIRSFLNNRRQGVLP